MAEANSQKKEKPRKRGKGRGLIFFVAVSLMVWKMPYAFILILGMLPGAVSWLFDRDRSKLTSVTVLALNFTALAPLLVMLWNAGGAMDYAVSIMTNTVHWVIILLSVLLGWIFAQLLPAFVVSIIMVRERGQVKRMRGRQKQLVEEWGEEVKE